MLIASSLSDLTDPNPTGVDKPWLRSRIEVALFDEGAPFDGPA
jgi:hypothetical protein